MSLRVSILMGAQIMASFSWEASVVKKKGRCLDIPIERVSQGKRNPLNGFVKKPVFLEKPFVGDQLVENKIPAILADAGAKTNQDTKVEKRARADRERIRRQRDGKNTTVGSERGVIKFFNREPEKCFGYITPDAPMRDVFVHIEQVPSSMLSSFKAGKRVRFDIESNSKTQKLRAINLSFEE